MSLYNGWNALAIGQAINNLQDRQHQQRTAIFDKFAQNLQNSIDESRARAEEKRNKEQALEYARSAGIDPEKAKYLAGMSPEAIYQQALGLEAEKRGDDRTIAAENRAEQRGLDSEKRQRTYAKEDETSRREWELAKIDYMRELERVDREIAQGTESLDKGFQLRKDLALQVMAKARDNVAPSQADIDEYNNIMGELIKFTTEHKEYGGELGPILLSAANGGKGVVSFDQRIADLKALEKNGIVDPAELSAFRENLVKEGLWSALYEKQGYKDVYDMLYKKQSGGKGKRGNSNLGSENIKTEEDAKKDYERELENARFAGEVKKVNDFILSDYNDPNIEIPNISEADLKKMDPKLRNNFIYAKKRRLKMKEGK